MAVLLDERDDGLAGHVAAADQRVAVVELRGVQELPPAGLGAVQVGGEKDSWHSYPSTSTLRISRSKPMTWRRMIDSARSASWASTASSRATCSSTASRSRTS